MSVKPVVLVVDDENRIVETLSLILKGHGFLVFIARSGEEAVNVTRGVQPDWVICDIVLGEINGIDAAITIRELCPTCHILLMSGHGETGDLLEAARRNGHEFDVLAKPFHPIELLGRIAA
jgi:DNA-binding response OmpR family regulator